MRGSGGIVIVLAALAAGESNAAAQPGLTPPSSVDPADVDDVPPLVLEERTPDRDVPSVGRVLEEDPGADHVILTPTALTQPAGSWIIHDREILALGMSLGVTDRLQLSFTVIPVVEDDERVGAATIKAQVVRTDALAVAVHAGLAGATSDEPLSVVGLLATACGDRCRRNVTAYAARLRYHDSHAPDDAWVLSLAATAAAGDHVKVLGEVSALSADDEHVLTCQYGIRLHGTSVAVDIGMLQVLDGDAPLGAPWIALAYRVN